MSQPFNKHWSKQRSNSSPMNRISTTIGPVNSKQLPNGRITPNEKHSRGHSNSIPRGNAEDYMNYKTVQRIDATVNEILKTVSSVSVYEYLESSEAWERTSIEGTLFIYKRSSSPFYAFLILNRLSNENLQMQLQQEVLVHTQYPFVLLRKTATDKVYGLSFTDETTCYEVGEELLRVCTSNSQNLENGTSHDLSNKESGRQHLSPSPISDHNSGSSQDGTHSDTQISSTPSHSTSLSVQHRKDSARKQRTTSSRRSSEPVSVNNKGKHRREVSPLSHSKVPNGYPSRSTGKGGNHRRSPNLVSSPEVTRSRSRQEREHNTGDIHGLDHPVSSSPRLVKRLFKTNSEDSTDSQTSETPDVLQNLFANATSSNSFSSTSSRTFSSPSTLKAVSLAEVERQITMEESISTENETNVPETQVTTSSVNTSVLLHPSMFSSPTPVENIAPNGQSGFENRLSPVQTSQLQVNVQPPTPDPATIKPIFPSIPPLVNSPGMRAFPISVQNPIPNHSNTTTPGTVGVVDSTTSDVTHQQRNVEQLSVTPPLLPLSSSSSLMSPMQFSSAPHKSYSEPSKGTEETDIGLTKLQLQQALLYLIKNDAGFIDILHEAYIKSLSNKS